MTDSAHPSEGTDSVDSAAAQWGVRFHDGSVLHPWNGRTQEQRAREALDDLRAKYDTRGRDIDRMVLVLRDGPDEPWREVAE